MPALGRPKTGGRKAGTPNRATVALRTRIEHDADPIGFLCDVVRGRRVDGRRPTTGQRIRAAKALADKLPREVDLSAFLAQVALAAAADARRRTELPEGINPAFFGPHTLGRAVLKLYRKA